MLDFLTFALCVPYSETTDGKHFDMLLELVADRGRYLFRLFQVSYTLFFVNTLVYLFDILNRIFFKLHRSGFYQNLGGQRTCVTCLIYVCATEPRVDACY